MMPWTALVAAVVAAGTAVILAIIGATWALGLRLGRIEAHGAAIQERVGGLADDVKELKGELQRRIVT